MKLFIYDLNKMANISYYMIFGKPVIIWLGIGTGFFMILAGFTAFLNMRRIKFLNMKRHRFFGYLAIVLGIMHGILAMGGYY